jgi:predicted metal-dependent HD superfamily phosphohydrolase
VSSSDAELRRAWRRVAGAGHELLVEELIARHGEPHRHYHTARHVTVVLRHVGELLDAHPADVRRDDEAIIAAALFHDVVYEPRSATNEADSAALAERALAQVGWPVSRAETVGTLVRATANHLFNDQLPGGAAILFDADLAVLGAEPQVYAAYVTAVRHEYAHVDDEQWRAGRATVLRGILSRSPIYLTPTMGARREHRARANLAAELAGLSRP